MNNVTLNNEVFNVNEFADHEIVPLLVLLQSGLGDPDAKFKAAKAIKKVIIPSLPSWAIREVDNDTYTFMLDSDEINLLLMQILKFHYEFQIERATKRNKSKELIDQLKESLSDTKNALKVLDVNQQLGKIINISGAVEFDNTGTTSLPESSTESADEADPEKEKVALQKRLDELAKNEQVK